jgi:hypothetical protein
VPAARAASTSTKLTRRCASRTCPRVSWPSAKTTAASTATGPRRCKCCWRACKSASGASAKRARRQTRKGLIGSGDRSDRIRTYNFPQGRVTDHRINLTLYKLPAVLEGDLDDLVRPLQLAHGAEQMAELEARAAG